MVQTMTTLNPCCAVHEARRWLRLHRVVSHMDLFLKSRGSQCELQGLEYRLAVRMHNATAGT